MGSLKLQMRISEGVMIILWALSTRSSNGRRSPTDTATTPLIAGCQSMHVIVRSLLNSRSVNDWNSCPATFANRNAIVLMQSQCTYKLKQQLVSYVKLIKYYDLYLLIRWRLGNRCCRVWNDFCFSNKNAMWLLTRLPANKTWDNLADWTKTSLTSDANDKMRLSKQS